MVGRQTTGLDKTQPEEICGNYKTVKQNGVSDNCDRNPQNDELGNIWDTHSIQDIAHMFL